jgi:hypothetical protein
MSRWLIRIGVFCLALGALLMSPLADLMPVDASAFFSQSMTSGHFRAVPTGENWGYGGNTLVVVGSVLLCAGLVARRRHR